MYSNFKRNIAVASVWYREYKNAFIDEWNATNNLF